MFHYPVPDGHFQHASRGFAVVDVETSGLDPARARIIEIAIVRTDLRGRVLGEFETLVDPGDGDTGEVGVHGITPRMVHTLLVSLVAFTLLYATLLRQRVRLERAAGALACFRLLVEEDHAPALGTRG